jgi:hypothetical protein
VANKWDERKKAQEDEYFVKKERELLAKLKAKQESEAKEAQKAFHMRCPKCGAALKERSFQKIQIDQCTACNGIWLDAGELEAVAAREDESWLGKFWKKSS